jgi:hypothetical protein
VEHGEGDWSGDRRDIVSVVRAGSVAAGEFVFDQGEGWPAGHDGAVLADSESDLSVWRIVYGGGVALLFGVGTAGGGFGDCAAADRQGSQGRTGFGWGVWGGVRALQEQDVVLRWLVSAAHEDYIVPMDKAVGCAGGGAVGCADVSAGSSSKGGEGAYFSGLPGSWNTGCRLLDGDD